MRGGEGEGQERSGGGGEESSEERATEGKMLGRGGGVR